MRIHGLTVCVNYADYLALTLPRWLDGLASLVVVTSHADTATQRLCEASGVRTHITDVFYANGAAFNKGAAIAEAWPLVPHDDWCLFFDADILPPAGWLAKVESAGVKPGSIYGCRRHQIPDVSRPDVWETATPNEPPGIGFFQLFHGSDPHAQVEPIVDTCWTHAGVYDSTFMHRWSREYPADIGLRVGHLGEREQWFGRGNHSAFVEMQAERRNRGGWQHERIGIRSIERFSEPLPQLQLDKLWSCCDATS